MKIKEVIDELKINPDKILNNIDEPELLKIIKYLSDKYYNKNESILSDNLFDYIKEFYDKNFNKTDIVSIGAVVSNLASNKVKLPYYMGSLDKIKPSTGTFNKWIDKYNGPYILSYKLDGISALLYRKNNKNYLYTRGNGLEGQDISHLIENLKINTSQLIDGDAIRGELIMSKNNFKKIEDKMANSRNAVAGIVNTKKPDIEMLKLIDFVPYWILNPSFKLSEQLKYIGSKNIKTVEFFKKNKITTEELSELLIDGRKNHKYEIDGIVVIDDSQYYPIIPGTNPNFGFAFKQILTDQIAESTVIDVIWEISKDMYIKPKIKIDTVELLGSEITYATAFNAKYIVDNKIGPGSRVKIIKSGDVIPYIMEILSTSDTNKPKMPSFEYEWNETNVDIIAVNLNEDNMNKLIVKKLSYFFSTLNIRFMGEGTIEKFVDHGYDDLWKILSADKDKIKKINGLGSKSVDKIYESIEDGLLNLKIYDLMCASQIFGRGIGSRKFKLIIDMYPNIIEIYTNMGKDHTIKIINTISGFEIKTTNKIVDNMDKFIDYYKKLIKLKPNILKENDKNNTNKSISINNKLKKYSGKTIVFTGFRDKEIETSLEAVNTKITNSVSKNTDILVASDPNEKSSKIIKAQELDIIIMSKDEFLKSLK